MQDEIQETTDYCRFGLPLDLCSVEVEHIDREITFTQRSPSSPFVRAS